MILRPDPECPEPPSFWLSRPRPVREVRYAVVGGGLVGLSTAYWLSRSLPNGEASEVAVLEAGGIGERASGRNAGFLLTGSAEPLVELAKVVGEETALRFWELSRENRELLRRELLDDAEGGGPPVECEFLPEGSWIASLDDPAAKAILESSAARLEAAGFELRWVEGQELVQASGSSGLGAALYQPRDGGLDPVALTRGIVRTGGFPVHTGVRVRSLEPAGDRVRLVADGGDWLAERVVVALNAYSPELLPHLQGAVRPVRGQMLAMEPGARPLRGVWYIEDGYQYLRQLPDGTLLLGGCRHHDRDREVGFAETPTEPIQKALEEFLHQRFPAFSGRSVARRWAGIMAFTDDGLPMIGEVPEVPGAIYAAGFNGHGLSLGFAAGRHLAHCAIEGAVTPLLP
ncbi:MAG: FAD-binding oxidoreductase [Acidobacteriota bacterium]|nr:FAD-binding oxidoreductase [Acidobacteriota bacterium]